MSSRNWLLITNDILMKYKHFTAQIIFAIVAIILAHSSAFAQCAMCKANIANSENVAEATRIMNTAVLVLLIPAVALFSFFIGLVLKFRHSQGGEMFEAVPEFTPRQPLRERFKKWSKRAERVEENLHGTY